MLDTERAGKKVEDKEKCKTLGFPESSEVKNLPANAGDKFDPWSRKIPHASGQLSLCATTTEPPHLEPEIRNKRSHCNEGSTHCNQRVAPAHSNKDPEQPQSKVSKNSLYNQFDNLKHTSTTEFLYYSTQIWNLYTYLYCLKFLVIMLYSIKFHFKVILILMAAFSYHSMNFTMCHCLHSFLVIKYPTKKTYHEYFGEKDKGHK